MQRVEGGWPRRLRTIVRRARWPVVLSASIVLAAVSAAGSGAAGAGSQPAPRVMTAEQAKLAALAEQGLTRTQELWWNPKAQWYAGSLSGVPATASVWWMFPLLEATAAVAIANPTRWNKLRVNEMFSGAEGYWDPTLEGGSGGVAANWHVSPSYHAFFDDAGWWGVAYLDAYRATGRKRWLDDAARALTFIDRFGWDWGRGGVWWDTGHKKKTSEPLAAGILIAATLYKIEHKQAYLAIAKRYLAWANAKTRNPRQGDLYGRNANDGTVMDYVEGMMIAAHVELCVSTGQQAYCRAAERLAEASLEQFPLLADWAPETDVVYLRGIARLYELDHDPLWYTMLYENAARAAAKARNAKGLWSKRWDGGWTAPGVIYTQAATLELFAWTSTLVPPATR
jgi:hypothetical protein